MSSAGLVFLISQTAQGSLFCNRATIHYRVSLANSVTLCTTTADTALRQTHDGTILIFSDPLNNSTIFERASKQLKSKNRPSPFMF